MKHIEDLLKDLLQVSPHSIIELISLKKTNHAIHALNGGYLFGSYGYFAFEQRFCPGQLYALSGESVVLRERKRAITGLVTGVMKN